MEATTRELMDQHASCTGIGVFTGSSDPLGRMEAAIPRPIKPSKNWHQRSAFVDVPLSVLALQIDHLIHHCCLPHLPASMLSNAAALVLVLASCIAQGAAQIERGFSWSFADDVSFIRYPRLWTELTGIF